jgi:hypothetical protein
MTLELTNADAQRLHALLHDYLPELKREAARSDNHDLRHELILRQELCERLITELAGKTNRP